MVDHREHVGCEKEQEEEEVFVILEAKAVVDECAMMVKALHALVAVVAMHAILRV